STPGCAAPVCARCSARSPSRPVRRSTLTGRMRPTEGSATVGGAAIPERLAAARRVGALAHVPGVTDLDPSLTVGEHLRERALLQRRFGGSLRGLLRPRAERVAWTRGRIERALAAAGLDRDALPKGSRTAVRDLERVEELRLSVALALIGEPGLLGVDDTDLKLSGTERAEVWTLLRSIAAAGTTVVAVCSEAPEGSLVVSTADHDNADSATATESAVAAEEATTAEADAEETDATDKEAAADSPAGAADDTKEGGADAFAETGRA
ncbi:ATP-binding cassette domain-containing protein, partial [Streptomyces sp. NPDC003832]